MHKCKCWQLYPMSHPTFTPLAESICKYEYMPDHSNKQSNVLSAWSLNVYNLQYLSIKIAYRTLKASLQIFHKCHWSKQLGNVRIGNACRFSLITNLMPQATWYGVVFQDSPSTTVPSGSVILMGLLSFAAFSASSASCSAFSLL